MKPVISGLGLSRVAVFTAIILPFYTNRHVVVSDYFVRTIREDRSKWLWLFVLGEEIAYYDYKSGFVLPYYDQIKKDL